MNPSDSQRSGLLAAARHGIDALLAAKRVAIETWFERQWQTAAAPFYASVDLRNAGIKLSAIDTNLFPAGFNNLAPAFYPLCVDAVRAEVGRICSAARGVVLVPENHTRNMYYFEHLAALTELLTAAGLTVRIGSLLPDLREPLAVQLASGRRLLLEPLQRAGNRVTVGDFDPCLVLLNNDLSGGRPPILEGIDQPVAPPLALGWSNRRKSDHFAHYQTVATEFAGFFDLDPWLIDPIFRNCGQIDFEKRAGEDCLSRNVEAVLSGVAEKYKEYGIGREPFVIVKADAGTYGMAIMSVTHADDVRDLNRKQRTKMSHAKEGQTVTQVLVQEGVYTTETIGSPPRTAEPVIYMIGQRVVGGFYRVHPERGPTDNLNAPGMQFHSMTPDLPGPDRFYAYGVVARLALLAAAREIRAAA
jgi:glutamate--cysteine ligase